MENPIKMDDLGVPLFSEASVDSTNNFSARGTLAQHPTEADAVGAQGLVGLGPTMPWVRGAWGPRFFRIPKNILVGGLNPFQKYIKILVKFDDFPRDPGENKKCLKPPPRKVCCKNMLLCIL